MNWSKWCQKFGFEWRKQVVWLIWYLFHEHQSAPYYRSASSNFDWFYSDDRQLGQKGWYSRYVYLMCCNHWLFFSDLSTNLFLLITVDRFSFDYKSCHILVWWCYPIQWYSLPLSSLKLWGWLQFRQYLQFFRIDQTMFACIHEAKDHINQSLYQFCRFFWASFLPWHKPYLIMRTCNISDQG